MSDKPLVLELPADLLDRAYTANLDLRQLLIDALQSKLSFQEDEILHILEKRLPPEKVQAALHDVRSGKRILGLHADTIWISDDFDDELPDEFWLGDDA